MTEIEKPVSAAAAPAAGFDRPATLKNGTAVRVRAVRPDDKARFAEAFRNLERESIYTRLFHHKKELSPAELEVATEVDFENEVALVVTVGDGDGETIIGGGRFALIDAPGALRTAEVAFLVEEDYHGQGLAGLLLRHLAEIARGMGVQQFEAEVLAGNRAMLRVFERSGLSVRQTSGGDVVHVSMSLAPEPPATD